MNYNFFDNLIVVPKIQVIRPPVCHAYNNNSSQGENIFELSILFENENWFRRLPFKLNDTEVIEKRPNKNVIDSYLIAKDGSELPKNSYNIPLETLKASERIMPVFSALLEAIETYHKKQPVVIK